MMKVSNDLPKITELGPKSFDELDLPPTLYKYRTWEQPFHQRILRNKEVYFARPDSFKDKLDCKIPLRYDLLTDNYIRARYRNDLRKENPDWEEQRINLEAEIWFKKGLLRDKNRIKALEEQFWLEFNERFGILSLTPIWNSIEMLQYYSSGFSGFCVGFDTINLVQDQQSFGGGGEVAYYDELPVLIPEKYDRMHLFLMQVYSKLRKWEFENEYRLTKTNIRQRNVEVPIDVFQEVIIGPKITKKNKGEIRATVKSIFPDVHIMEAYFDKKAIKRRRI